MQNDRPAAENAVKTIYITENQAEVDLVLGFMSRNNQKTTSTVTLKQAFTDPEYKKG